MTIQLLHPYNGNRPGIYSSMGAVEEARLVGLGLARYWADGIDGKNTQFSEAEKAAGQALVSPDWNSDTPGGALRRVLSNVIGHKIPGINISVGALAGRTYCMKIALPAEFDAIQLVHYHHETAGTTVYSAAIAATETAAAD